MLKWAARSSRRQAPPRPRRSREEEEDRVSASCPQLPSPTSLAPTAPTVQTVASGVESTHVIQTLHRVTSSPFAPADAGPAAGSAARWRACTPFVAHARWRWAPGG